PWVPATLAFALDHPGATPARRASLTPQARAQDAKSEDKYQCKIRPLSHESGRPVMGLPPQQPSLAVVDKLHASNHIPGASSPLATRRSVNPTTYRPVPPKHHSPEPRCPIGTWGGEYGPTAQFGSVNC
ncbi:unnamed protein product, partial [Rhizoctonia solani]